MEFLTSIFDYLAQDLFGNFIVVVLCILALTYGATLMVDSAARMARKLRVSELVIGLTVVAIGTSAPEFAVTITAALRGQTDISVSNVVGSNIFNLGFILGAVLLIRAIPTSKKLVYRDGLFLTAVTVLLVFFMLDLNLARWEGGVLFAILIGYIAFLYRQREAPDDDLPEGEFKWMDVPIFLIGIALIVAGGQFLVGSATSIARYYSISEWVIGATIVAAGTSAPEMATSLVGAMRGHENISIGNLVGSDLFNLLGVLGLAGLIQTTPMLIDATGLGSLYFLSGKVILVVILMRKGWQLTRLDGALLILINAIQWGFFFFQGPNG